MGISTLNYISSRHYVF